jgi:hypothetical protein
MDPNKTPSMGHGPTKSEEMFKNPATLGLFASLT